MDETKSQGFLRRPQLHGSIILRGLQDEQKSVAGVQRPRPTTKYKDSFRIVVAEKKQRRVPLMAYKKDTTDLSGILLECLGSQDPMLHMLE